MAQPFELVDEWELLLYSIALDQLKRQKAALLDASFFAAGFWDREYILMAAAFAPAIEEIMLGGILFSTPEGLDVSALFENQRIYAEQHAGELIRNINEVTRQRVNEMVQQSITEGWDIDTLTENLEEWFSETRARRIAITETTNAFGGGAQLANDELRAQGKNVALRWLTANDDRVCEICAPRHLKFQGDGWEVAEAAHVGCRCDWVNEIVGII